jgi:hypothetical protein
MAKKQQKKWYLQTLHLGVQNIDVKEVAELGDWGQYWEHPKPTILISPQDESMLPTTLLHELLHAASAAYELELSERQVRALDQLIPLLLRQNPELARRLLG